MTTVAGQAGAEPRKKVLFVTYTMADPFAVGVFFRALRLGFEMQKIGWDSCVCNYGGIPQDPKVEQARNVLEIIDEPPSLSEGRSAHFRFFKRIDPDVVVFGEEPIPPLEACYRAAKMLSAPFVLLEQFYDSEVAAERFGVDIMLLYGLRQLWGSRPEDRPGFYAIIPPFIDEVTPKSELPVPAGLPDYPWVTVTGFDQRVLEGGIELAATLRELPLVTITLSHSPADAEDLMSSAGIPPKHRLALPLQQDRDLFGFFSASKAVIVANGFMQIMEALALGSPVICISRGIGMDGWGLDETFEPYVSIEENMSERQAKLRRWLEESPFSESQLAGLGSERNGARICREHIKAVARAPRLFRRLQRLSSRARWMISSAFDAKGQPSAQDSAANSNPTSASSSKDRVPTGSD